MFTRHIMQPSYNAPAVPAVLIAPDLVATDIALHATSVDSWGLNALSGDLCLAHGKKTEKVTSHQDTGFAFSQQANKGF